jgi:hypothetical protein
MGPRAATDLVARAVGLPRPGVAGVRSPKHHPRPAPWQRKGWKPAPNALTPDEIAAAMHAAPTTTAMLPDNLRNFQVGVVARRRGGYEAYTRFCAGWEGFCVHGVSATSGAEAKALAILAHVRSCVQQGKVER